MIVWIDVRRSPREVGQNSDLRVPDLKAPGLSIVTIGRQCRRVDKRSGRKDSADRSQLPSLSRSLGIRILAGAGRQRRGSASNDQSPT